MKTFKEYIEESVNSIQYTVFKELDPEMAQKNKNMFNMFLNALVEREGGNIRELVYAVESGVISLERMKRIVKNMWNKIKEKHEYIY